MSNLAYPSCEDKIFWGFVEHFRFWLVFDGVELNRLRHSNSGYLDRKSVRRIAQNYSVNRGIVAAKKKGNKVISDNPARWLACTVNRFDSSNILTLEDRAEWCAGKICDAERKKITHNKQASAITKLLWFRCQDGWTVFDAHASSAVGAKGKNAIFCMTNFYKLLSYRGFVQCAEEVDKYLKNEKFGFLHGCRVIDAFLMLNSTDKDWPEEAINNCLSFLNCLPNPLQTNVIEAGKKIPRTMEILVRKE